MVDHLRPSLIVEQKFVTQAPVVITSPLDLIFFGIQRQVEYRAGAGDYEGGIANPSYSFPSLIAGSVVERPTATEVALRPHVYIQNRFGVAEVAPTYNWLVDPPLFTLSPTLDATFEISKGTTGAYSAATGKFIDANADFIEDEVAALDVIKVNGIPAFEVAAIVTDDELDVTKLDKGPATYSGDLSAEDINLDRTLADADFDFSEVCTVGDIVTVRGWDVLAQADGIDYTAETLGVRVMTGPTQDFVTAGVQPPIVGPPYQVDIAWIKDIAGDWSPAFKIVGAVLPTTLNVSNLITLPAWPTVAGADTNEVFEIFHYTAVDLTGGAVWTDVNGDWTADGTPLPGQRTFSISGGNPNAIDFSTLLVLPLSRYSIAVHGVNSAMGTANARPIFKIVSIIGFPAPSTSLVVENWDPDRPALSATGTGTTWEIWDDGATALCSFLGASITAENPADLNKRTLTSTYNNFVVAGVAAGDIVYSDAGVAMFLVTNVDFPTILRCVNIVPGTPPPTWNTAEFGFAIMDITDAQLRVTRIVDANTIGVRDVLAGSPPAAAFTDLYYEINVADTLNNISYTIEKTLSGVALTGTVLCSYTARRNDHLAEVVEVTKDNRDDTAGFAIPANPVGLGAYLALLNTPYSVFFSQVEEDTVLAWAAALEPSKAARYFVLAPLTQNETVLGAYRTHVDLQSAPEIKRERIMFQNHAFERVTERTTDQAGDAAAYTKGPAITSILVARDLSAYGVVVGDVFNGFAPAFTARIITIVSGVTTTLTVVNDNGLPIGGPVPITDWMIESKTLSDAQFADAIAAYPVSLKDRRIRNVYPDRAEFIFTDNTDPANNSGTYGGGDVTEELGGEYLAIMCGAIRSGQKPGVPLSRFGMTGVHKLLNPFGDPEGGNEDLNDRILDGGNWLLSQPSDDADVFAIRAVTTDVSDIYFLEDHVTVQIDNFARLLRNQIRPLLGPFNIGDEFFDVVSANGEAVRRQVLDDKDARAIEFLGINEVPNLPDTFAMDYDFTPYVTGAKGRVTIFI